MSTRPHENDYLYLYDDRWTEEGIGRYAGEVLTRLPPGQGVGPVEKFHPLEALRLSQAFDASGCRVFYSPSFVPPAFSRRPFVFTVHDLIHLEFAEESSLGKRAFYHTVVRLAAQRAFRVATVSEFSKQKIVQTFGVSPDRVEVLPNGVDRAFSPEGERFDPGFPYVLYVGNHKPHKNLARLYEAFGQLKASGQLEGDLARLKLIVSGKPSSEERHLLLRLGLHQEVVFAGFIPDEQLPAYYRGAQALVLVSLYEGFGLPVLEAMACGTPVVTSDRTSLPEVAGEAAVLVNPLEVSSIASGLERVLTDEALRAELRAKGLARAAEFSWDTTAAKVRAVLEAALESARAQRPER